MDFEALRKKLAETKEKTANRGGNGADFWKPKDGRNVIRILPATDGGDDFYAEALVHYNVGPKSKMVTCGKTDGNSCKVCDFVQELFDSGDADDLKLAKKMKAKTRYYFNVIDRTLEPKDEKFGTVMVYGAGVGVFQDVLGIIVDPDFGNITDPKIGRDVIITKSGKGLDTEYNVQGRPIQNEVGIEDWEKKMVDLTRYRKSRTPEDMMKILLGEDAGDSEGGGSQPEAPKQERPAVAPEPEGSKDEVEAEIEAMLKRHKK